MTYIGTPDDIDQYRDPHHLEVHKVVRHELEAYKAGQRKTVRAECGKIWAPTIPTDESKPQCPICFPPRSPYAIAA